MEGRGEECGEKDVEREERGESERERERNKMVQYIT